MFISRKSVIAVMVINALSAYFGIIPVFAPYFNGIIPLFEG